MRKKQLNKNLAGDGVKDSIGTEAVGHIRDMKRQHHQTELKRINYEKRRREEFEGRDATEPITRPGQLFKHVDRESSKNQEQLYFAQEIEKILGRDTFGQIMGMPQHLDAPKYNISKYQRSNDLAKAKKAKLEPELEKNPFINLDNHSINMKNSPRRFKRSPEWLINRNNTMKKMGPESGDILQDYLQHQELDRVAKELLDRNQETALSPDMLKRNLNDRHQREKQRVFPTIGLVKDDKVYMTLNKQEARALEEAPLGIDDATAAKHHNL